jgi:hypothetical protein
MRIERIVSRKRCAFSIAPYDRGAETIRDRFGLFWKILWKAYNQALAVQFSHFFDK